MKNTTVEVSIEGGIGNQLFQYAAAEYLFGTYPTKYSKFSDSPRELSQETIDLAKILGIEIQTSYVNYIFRKLLNLALRMSAWEPTFLNSFVKKVYVSNVSLILSVMKQKRINIVTADGVGFSNPKIKKGFHNIVIGYFQSYIFAESASFKTTLKETISNYGLSINPTNQIVSPIIIHIRLGDYLADSSIGALGSDYFRRALREISESDLSQVWVFSNDLERARTMFSEQVADLLNFIDDSELTSIQVLFTMSHGTAYILSNSTFSWWAAFLANHEKAQVIVPEPWFANRQEPALLIPSTWTRITR